MDTVTDELGGEALKFDFLTDVQAVHTKSYRCRQVVEEEQIFKKYNNPSQGTSDKFLTNI